MMAQLKTSSAPMRISIIHLDMGIGGAEQLVVNIACSMKELGHEVKIFTANHDKNHCFEETKPGGVLGDCIHVHGGWMPRSVVGRFTALFSIIRMLYLAFIVVFLYFSWTDLVFIDGVSAPIPWLVFCRQRVLFYCHHPDSLLCVGAGRNSALKKLYRFVIDGLEEWSTGCAHAVIVNSAYTRSMYTATFRHLAATQRLPSILYPVVNQVPPLAETPAQMKALVHYTAGYDHVFVSLNRYERKKKIELAIDALVSLEKALRSPLDDDDHGDDIHKNVNSNRHNYSRGKALMTTTTAEKKILLVIAGGYDVSLPENVEYLQELRQHCADVGVSATCMSDLVTGCSSTGKAISSIIGTSGNSNEAHSLTASASAAFLKGVEIVFRTSISTKERTALVQTAAGLLYTPANEHFGIVPLEAMLLGTPVVAVNNGGPLETVLDGVSGFLCEQQPEAFAEAMRRLIAPVTAEQLKILDENNNSGRAACQEKEEEDDDDDDIHKKKNSSSSAVKKGRSTPRKQSAAAAAALNANADPIVSESPSPLPQQQQQQLLLHNVMAPHAKAHVVGKFTSQVMKATLEGYLQSARSDGSDSGKSESRGNRDKRQ